MITSPPMSRRSFALAAGFSLGARPASPNPAIEPGEPLFLLERSTVEDIWALARRVHPLVKSSRNPLIVKDREWEGSGPYLYGSVLFDPADRLFKCWYTVYRDHEYRNRLPGSYVTCYATSRDGFAWEKPALGVQQWKGSKQNNLIRLGRKYVGSITVILTPPGAGVRQRFIACYLDSPGVCLAFSDDGVTWTEHPGNPVDPRHSDTHNSIVWDPWRRRWLIHHRAGLHAGPSNRRIAVVESQDLRAWKRPEVVLRPDEADFPGFYGMPVFRRGNLFFGLLEIYNHPRGSIEIELAFSADGYLWERVPPRDLFLPRGAPGAWDGGMVVTASEPVVFGGQMRLYYGGWRVDHNQEMPDGVPLAAIGLAAVPQDRFFGLHTAGDEPGVLLTRPLELRARALEVNAAVEGEFRLALLGVEGKELPGFGFSAMKPVRGDALRQRVHWTAKELPRQPVRLKAEWTRGALYAIYGV